MVPGEAIEIRSGRSGELRIQGDQGRALYCGSRQARAGQERIERIRKVGGHVVNIWLVPHGRVAQVLKRYRIQIPADLDVCAAVADIAEVEQHPARKLALDAELPALRIWRILVSRVKRNVTAEERGQSQARARR